MTKSSDIPKVNDAQHLYPVPKGPIDVRKTSRLELLSQLSSIPYFIDRITSQSIHEAIFCSQFN